MQVAPAELEEVLLRHEKVQDVAVIGIPDLESGEIPKAFVVKKDSSLTEEEIHEFLKGDYLLTNMENSNKTIYHKLSFSNTTCNVLYLWLPKSVIQNFDFVFVVFSLIRISFSHWSGISKSDQKLDLLWK